MRNPVASACTLAVLLDGKERIEATDDTSW
jgi:hypothetical protein